MVESLFSQKDWISVRSFQTSLSSLCMYELVVLVGRGSSKLILRVRGLN